ncbi:MAG: hypothetical protein LC667_07880 [Thioalkalivibrio sp.]|nr:hypothetical protein [Thioalkalivibrio sp.]
MTYINSGGRWVEVMWVDESTSESEFRVARRGAELDWETVNTIIFVSPTMPNDTGRSYRFVDRSPYDDRENCFRVTALNADFDANSNVLCAFTFPYEARDLEVTERRTDGFSLRWTDNAENEDGYFISHCRMLNGERISESCTDTASVGPFSGLGNMDIDGLQPSTDYQLNLYVFNSAAARLHSMTVEARTRPGQATIDGAELFYGSSLNLVPFNPSSTQKMTLDWFACNVGQQTPSQEWVTSIGVYLDGVLIDQDEVDGAALATGECLQQAVTIGPLQPGYYSLMTVLDGTMTVLEADEDNNTSTYGVIISD